MNYREVSNKYLEWNIWFQFVVRNNRGIIPFFQDHN